MIDYNKSLAVENKEQLEAQAFVQQQHQQWLSIPTTVAAIARLRLFKERQVNKISNASNNPNITDSELRHMACALENTNVILNLLTDSKTFVTKISEQ